MVATNVYDYDWCNGGSFSIFNNFKLASTSEGVRICVITDLNTNGADGGGYRVLAR